MYLFRLVARNAFRHKLRTGLTMLGIVVAIVAFGLLQTVVAAWYAGSEAASVRRVITRNAISLVFTLPITYAARIRAVPGVHAVSWANWFGGVYQDPKNFFPRFAIEAESYLRMYPEYILDPDQRTAFMRDRKGCIVGRKLADTYGFRVGDTLPLRGTIFPGNWAFTIRGIYEGREARTDTNVMFFHWEYLNETMKKTVPRRANQTGVYIVELDNPDRAALVSRAIDEEFRNSLAETLTETEQQFQLSFVAMVDTIVVAIKVVSFVVIVIILAVMANTMAMTARERLAEHATFKALGFGPRFLGGLILGESLAIALPGGLIGMALTIPVTAFVGRALASVFPVFRVDPTTFLLQLACAASVGVLAGLVPAVRAGRVRIVDGLRHIG